MLEKVLLFIRTALYRVFRKATGVNFKIHKIALTPYLSSLLVNLLILVLINGYQRGLLFAVMQVDSEHCCFSKLLFEPYVFFWPKSLA